MNRSRLRRSAAALVLLFVVAPNVAGQGRPVPSVDSLVAEFLANPGGDVVARTGACPQVGTWKRELLERMLAEMPPNRRGADALINAQTYNVQRCDIPALNAWFQEALRTHTRKYGVGLVTRGLWNSGVRENRDAVVAAMFDATRGNDFRFPIAEMVAADPPYRDGYMAFLDVIATGYRQFGTTPPLNIANRVLSGVGSQGRALAAKQALLAAWRARADAPGSARLISLLANDAEADARRRGLTSTEWKSSVGSAMEDALAGRLAVSDDVRAEIQVRIARFRSP